MARNRERDRGRGRGRERPREDDEEAVARSTRRRIEATANQEGDEENDENREPQGAWRLTKTGLPLLLLMLATVSGVKSCLEKGGEEERKKVLTFLAGTKGAPISEAELTSLLASINGSVIDSQTGNVLCRNAKDAITNEPMVDVEISGRTFRLRKSFAEKVKAADEAMKEKLKERWLRKGHKWQGIDIDYGLRTNHEQYRIWLNALDLTTEDPLDTAWAASPPCMSYHETGRAIDVTNWGEAEPFLWGQEVPGGDHGIFKDPRHFSMGEFERKGEVDAMKQRLWQKTHGWKIWRKKGARGK